MDKAQMRRSRDAAVSINLNLDVGDSIKQIISRESGLFCITAKQIIRLRSPDDIDPELNHRDVPWEQHVYLPHGSTDWIVARTVLQTTKLLDIFFPEHSHKYVSMLDISWEVMNSLISLRVITPGRTKVTHRYSIIMLRI